MRIYWYSGWCLVAIGVIHNALGLVLGWDVIRGVAATGWWNSIEPDGRMDFARSALLWFLLTGFFWWLLGYLMQAWLSATGRPLPRLLGWGFLLAGAGVAYVLPVSGAWLFIPLGVLIIRGPGAHSGVGERTAHAA